MARAQTAPYASTLPAVPRTADTLLKGMAVPNGAATTCWFEWGIVGSSTTNRTSTQDIGSGSSVVYVTNTISVANPNTQYYCRLVASNSPTSVTYGAEQRFGNANAIIGWGENTYGQASAPTSATNVVAVSAGDSFSLALRADGTVVAWGANGDGETTVPTGLNNVIAIAAKGNLSMALGILNSGAISVGNPTLGFITATKQMDQWTFFARAGESYTVLVDPGSGCGVSPYLNFVEVMMLDTNGTVLASVTNSSSGTTVLLSNVAVTNDGVYSIQVHAAPKVSAVLQRTCR